VDRDFLETASGDVAPSLPGSLKQSTDNATTSDWVGVGVADRSPAFSRSMAVCMA
jgi:hypothetical protein